MDNFDIEIKFKDKEETRKYAKRLFEKIRYIGRKKNWSATAMICIGNIEENKTYVHYEHTGKVDHSKKVKETLLPYRNKNITAECFYILLWHPNPVIFLEMN